MENLLLDFNLLTSILNELKDMRNLRQFVLWKNLLPDNYADALNTLGLANTAF